MRTRNLLIVAAVLWLLAPADSNVDSFAQEAASHHIHGDSYSQRTPKAAVVNTKAPNFVLTDQEGRRFDSASLRGKVVVLDFIYTTCTDVCPFFTANFAELQHRLNAEQKRAIFLVSITTDPEIDSPKVLRSYGKRYKADFSNWAFLTATEAQLKEVWKGFGIRVIRRARGLVQHDSVTMLIDRQGVRRFNHWGEKVQLKDVEGELALLLAEKTPVDR
jgi:protein SCO1/2